MRNIKEDEYRNHKRKLRGFYVKFNSNVLKYHMRDMFNYEYLLKTAKNFENFEDFFNFHTKNKDKIIERSINKMYYKNKIRYKDLTKRKVFESIVVRMGNIYHGQYNENKIIIAFDNLEAWIKCEKTNKKIDTDYKVDAILTYGALERIGIQIKPISFKNYGLGSETTYHQDFYFKYDTEVHYIFYKDRDTVEICGETIKLYDRKKLLKTLEKLIYSN